MEWVKLHLLYNHNKKIIGCYKNTSIQFTKSIDIAKYSSKVCLLSFHEKRQRNNSYKYSYLSIQIMSELLLVLFWGNFQSRDNIRYVIGYLDKHKLHNWDLLIIENGQTIEIQLTAKQWFTKYRKTTSCNK